MEKEKKYLTDLEKDKFEEIKEMANALAEKRTRVGNMICAVDELRDEIKKETAEFNNHKAKVFSSVAEKYKCKDIGPDYEILL